MVRRTRFTGLLALILVSSVRGEWIPLHNASPVPVPPSVTLLSDDRTATELRIEIQGFELEGLKGYPGYRSLSLPGGTLTTTPGLPELPYVAKVIAVPDRGTVSIEVVSTEGEVSLRGFTPPPARQSWKEGDPEPLYGLHPAAYASPVPYPSAVATVDSPAVFRDFRLVRVAVYPIRYVAATNELLVARSVTVRLRYGPGDGPNPRTAPRRPIAPSFAPLYRSTIFNYQGILEREFGGEESGRDVLLCISPDAFVPTVMPFVEWRHKTGTFTRITKFSEIGANATNPDIIRNYLAQVYHTWQYPPTYVLLVGDYGQIPIRQIAYDYTIVSEDYFVEIDGNDFLPEMMIGRFTHEGTPAEQVIVNKIVGYEREPYVANTSWFLKGAVAGNNAYESQLETKRFTRDRMMIDGGFTVVDTFMSHSPCYSSLGDLLAVLSNGRSFLNYRGEGWYTGWWANCYHFQTSDVQSINNGRMLTFVTSIGCGVGAFNQSSCFGEQWLELGSATAPRGAVTFIGPTSNTHTTYNNKIDKGIYIGMFQEGMDTPGQALARGRLYMYEAFGNEHWVEYQTRVYCILGDPSVHIWKKVPRAVTVNHPAILPVGFNQVSYAVRDSATGLPVANAHVCVTGDSVFATGTTDVAGNVTMPITTEVPETLTVLVRGGDVIPYEGMQRVVTTIIHVAPLGNAYVTDVDGNHDGLIDPNELGSMVFTLKNWGSVTASDVRAELQSLDTTRGFVESTVPVSYGDIAPGATGIGEPFAFRALSTCPVGDTLRFRLHVTSQDSTWEYTQAVDVHGCRLAVHLATADDRGQPGANGRMDPGETVKIYLQLINAGDDGAPDVHAVLYSLDPRVTVIDSTGAFGTMAIDSMASNVADFFVVSVDDSCPARTIIPFSVRVYTENGPYPYSSTLSFTMPVAMPQQSDPTGPDDYGYYAYTSDDTTFEQAPEFSWTEINGVGTQVPASGNGDFTTTVTLPFTFRYYGANYTQVRVSSDGWIAFGSGTQTAFQNYALPHADNISAMTAAFWEDLFATSGETGKLLYYADAAQHRFIVEWWNVGHYNDATKKETFQVILRDPAFYPTATGDGEILVHYLNLAEPGGNTVGLEDPTQSIGLLYEFNEAYAESATPLRDSLSILFSTDHPQLVVHVGETGPSREIAATFGLGQNYPNPFNPTTKITYQIVESGPVTLNVYDLLGREVATIVDGEQHAGVHTATWNGTNSAGQQVGSGVYFYCLRSASQVLTRKLVLMR